MANRKTNLRSKGRDIAWELVAAADAIPSKLVFDLEGNRADETNFETKKEVATHEHELGGARSIGSDPRNAPPAQGLRTKRAHK
jgi:hypothetical protein